MLEQIRREFAAEIGYTFDTAKHIISRMITTEGRTGRVFIRTRMCPGSVVVAEVLTGRVIHKVPADQARRMAKEERNDTYLEDEYTAIYWVVTEQAEEEHHLYFGELLASEWEEDIPEGGVREAALYFDLAEVVSRMFAAAPNAPAADLASFLGMDVDEVRVAQVYIEWLNGNRNGLAPAVPIVRSIMKREEAKVGGCKDGTA